jgi:hypothetical protein
MSAFADGARSVSTFIRASHFPHRAPMIRMNDWEAVTASRALNAPPVPVIAPVASEGLGFDVVRHGRTSRSRRIAASASSVCQPSGKSAGSRDAIHAGALADSGRNGHSAQFVHWQHATCSRQVPAAAES